jgi:glycosyltransferase involved in cell wall biosynthesis
LALVPLLRSKKALIYYDAFEFYTVMFRNMGLLGRAFSLLCEKLENRYVPALDGVLCVTSLNNWLKKRMMLLHRKTVELWNLPSLDQSINKELTNEIRRQFFGRDLIVYIGGLKAHKGLTIFPDLVRQVARGHSRAHFLIIGNVQTEADVETWFNHEGIGEHCTYVPWVLPKVLNTYLFEATVGLVLSPPSGIHLLVGPGNGRKLFTYMATGLPVVAPNHGSAWDLVTKERIGLQVDTTRAEDVARGVLTLLEHKELREQMGNNAKTLFIERYNWECQENKYIEFIKSTN